eukprot:CAMPEP_0185698714 /NCGR_PEP_ID=MMETSP1164-20130828/6487_1 /TAXON_ID=1104430 /ORGANISM="Chrysoreinhardia sp, Strain CCMP2950" /LENGTH=288 /DNA_ID=CAMNT_0028365637 /DNA_START=37 /DNA_END=903 /DNA_ORIENTATION=+
MADTSSKRPSAAAVLLMMTTALTLRAAAAFVHHPGGGGGGVVAPRSGAGHVGGVRRHHRARLATTTMTVTSSPESAAATAEPPAAPQEPPFSVTDSGLRWRDEVVGKGKTPEKGVIVVIDYTGTLEATGRVFDSTYERGLTFQFELGRRDVIPGMEEGVKTMKVGGKRTIVVPPTLAYGSRDLGRIPPDSVLRFEIELRDVRSGPFAGIVAEVTNAVQGVARNLGPNPFTFFVALFVLLGAAPFLLPDESPLMYGSPDVLKISGSASKSSPLNADMDALGEELTSNAQ